MYALKYVNKE